MPHVSIMIYFDIFRPFGIIKILNKVFKFLNITDFRQDSLVKNADSSTI